MSGGRGDPEPSRAVARPPGGRCAPARPRNGETRDPARARIARARGDTRPTGATRHAEDRPHVATAASGSHDRLRLHAPRGARPTGAALGGADVRDVPRGTAVDPAR
ncbi:MAG: hypothetical protein D6689_14430 [Deltaproteobacteria bacterium]|nr:MAG: hypothetical protein D6689_14430 [Deltaproteobacteria bacterium]